MCVWGGAGGARADWERRPLEESAVALGQLRAASIHLSDMFYFYAFSRGGGAMLQQENNANHLARPQSHLGHCRTRVEVRTRPWGGYRALGIGLMVDRRVVRVINFE